MKTPSARTAGPPPPRPDGPPTLPASPHWLLPQGGHGPLQTSLFDPPDDPDRAQRARDEAIGNADAHANPQWKATAREAIRWCAAAYTDGFTADHVLRYLAERDVYTHNLAALGPLFLAASRAGEIRKTGEQWPSTIPRRHRDLTVWTAP